MKPKSILIVGFVIVMLIIIAGSGFFYNISNQILKEQIADHLETAAESRANHIETFLDENIEKVSAFADNQIVEDFLAGEIYSVGKINKELKEILEANDDFDQIFLLNNDKIIVASTSGEHVNKKVGHAVSSEDLLEPEISDIHFSELLNTNVIDFFAPIVHDEKSTNLGGFYVVIDLKKLAEITTDRTGLGETGEIIIVNKDGLLITPSRFLGGNAGVLVQAVNTENSEECLEDLEEYGDPELGEVEEHEEEILSILSYVSYSGEKVLGVHSYVKGKWCVLAEIQESEVLGKARTSLLIVSVIIVVLTSILIVLIIYFIGRQLDKKSIKK